MGIHTPAGLTPGAPTGIASKGSLLELSPEQALSFTSDQIRIHVELVPEIPEDVPVHEEIVKEVVLKQTFLQKVAKMLLLDK